LLPKFTVCGRDLDVVVDSIGLRGTGAIQNAPVVKDMSKMADRDVYKPSPKKAQRPPAKPKRLS